MKKNVYAYLHTHWDREWYRDKEDFNLRLLKVFDVVLDELKSNKAPFFYFDGQTIALLDYLKYRSENKDLIKKLIKENKLAIGPYYASIDSFLVSYPMMLKNLDLGLEISKSFGQKNFIGYMCDIFGVSKSAFRALGEKNIDKAVIWRGVNPAVVNNDCNFKYNKINTVWLVQGYFNDFLYGDIDIKTKANNIEICLEKISRFCPEDILLPIGADHLGILKDANKTIDKINSHLENYKIILCNPFEYFKKSNFENKAKVDEFIDNSNTYVLPGCWSSRIYQKTKNNVLENKISKVIEPLNHYLKYNYQKNIDFAYSTLIKCQAHDGICACSLDSVHRAIDARQEKIGNILGALEKNIIGDFKKEKNITGKIKDKIGIFNLANVEDINVVKITVPYKIKNSQILKKERRFSDELYYDIYSIPVTEQITTLYTQLVEIKNSQKFSFSTCLINSPQKKALISENSIENDFIKVQIKNKKIEIVNKNTKEKVFLKITDIKDEGDSYNYAPIGQAKALELLKTNIVEDGLIQCTLRLYFKNLKIDVVLDNHSKFLKFNSTINNRTKNHKIQCVFVLNDNVDYTIAQDAHGIIKREIDYNYKMQDFMPAPRPREIKTNSFPLQNFVNFKNNSILTKGLHEYEIYKNELRICLLRAFDTISNPKNKARFVPAGPNLETLEAQCLRETSQEFAFLFGDYKDSFNSLDKFFENYVSIDGEFKNDIKIKLDKMDENTYFYCINDGKKILFDYKDDINFDCRE